MLVLSRHGHNYGLGVSLWKVEKMRDIKKIAEIEKSCRKAKEVRNEFERFIKEL